MDRSLLIHPLWLRITHWSNAFAVVILIASGLKIYNAAPIFEFSFPGFLTLGGWLAGALRWHFAAMWLLMFNGLVYLLVNLATGRLHRQFFPLRASDVLRDLGLALRGKLAHGQNGRYNAVQRAAYLFVMAALVLVFLSGLVLWKSVQFPVLRELMGGYEMARRVHFVGMAALSAFVVVHIGMVALAPRTLLAMLRGR